MGEKFLSFFKQVGINGVIDICVMAILLYAVLTWFAKKRAMLGLIGIFIFGLFYLMADRFNLYLTEWVLQGFFAVLIIALIVIFQEEIRSFFERIAVWSLQSESRKRPLAPTESEIVVHTLHELARQRVGAILVIKGRDVIERHLEGGVELEGKISEPILLSIFDPHSRGHDGATMIDHHRILQFGCQLPLSKNLELIKGKGTRHAAALGLSEKCDALCLVVSQERGVISAVLKGEIQEIKSDEQLRDVLKKFYQETAPSARPRMWYDFFRKNPWEKIAALLLSLALWFFVVHESKYIVKSFRIPVEYFQIDPLLRVEEMSPDEVVATFSGPSNAFHLLSDKNIHLTVKVPNTEEGVATIHLTKTDFNFPKEITLQSIEPESVKVVLSKK